MPRKRLLDSDQVALRDCVSSICTSGQKMFQNLFMEQMLWCIEIHHGNFIIVMAFCSFLGVFFVHLKAPF